MRKGLFVTGIILLLIGLVSIAYPMFIGSSVSIVAFPDAVAPAPPLLGSGTFTVHWTGATDGTHVVLYECATSDCSVRGATLADVSGASGSLSVTLVSGHSYALYENGTAVSIPATVTIMGITTLILIGIVLLVIGLVVVVLSFRGRGARGASAPPSDGSAAEGPVAPERPTDTAAQSAGGRIEAGPQPVAGSRANRVCASCGTSNEPWITNCRKCKRPLASTSQ
ncbi:MAG: hypothetical protein L3J73_04360 [Thermoplasmata archaeon]|nr:hypothetical protein [Thermoplasmata archaeon]